MKQNPTRLIYIADHHGDAGKACLNAGKNRVRKTEMMRKKQARQEPVGRVLGPEMGLSMELAGDTQEVRYCFDAGSEDTE